MRVEFDARWNVYRQGPLARDPAAARTGLAGPLNDFTTALAGHAGASMAKTPGSHDLAKALAGRAGDGARSRFRASAATRRTGYGSWNANLRGLAVEGLAERDLHVVFEIGTALFGAPSPAAAAAHELAEEIIENLRHGG